MAVLLPDLVKVAGVQGVEGGGAHLIHRGGAQAALAPFHGLGHERLVLGDQHTHPRAAGGKALGHGVNDDHIVLIAFKLQAGHQRLPAVGELPVHLVADDEQLMLPGNIQHQLQLILGQHRAGGVAGVGDHDGTGVLIDAGFHAGPVGVGVTLLRLGGHRVNGGAGQGDGGMVVGIEGLRDDDLIAVVQNGGHDHLQGLAAAGGRQDIAPLQLHTDALVVGAYRVQQHGDTAGGSVGQDRVMEILNGLVENIRGLNIGLADVQMVDLDSALSGCVGVRVELTHGGEPAALHFG